MKTPGKEDGLDRISVIGLGKLGLCIAAIFAYKGYQVVGVDIDEDKIRSVNEARAPFYEPGLDNLLRAVVPSGRVVATSDYSYAINDTDITFVVVPTPSEPDGSYSNRYIGMAVKSIATELRNKNQYHLIVITSTVFPGTMEGLVRPLLEKYSGKKCVRDFGLCYNPEFIALGSVIQDFLSPDLVLIGESDGYSGEMLAHLYRTVCENEPYIVRTTFINAEIAKIAINSFITMKISFANTIAAICQRVPGANVDEVLRAVGLDSRIGSKYLRGGLGYGGPCFPRDNRAFLCFARRYGFEGRLAEATDWINERIPGEVVKMIEEVAAPSSEIVILGLTYKPGTYIVEESQAVTIARELASKGYKVLVHDPMGLSHAKRVLGTSVSYANSIDECLARGDVLVLAVPWQEYVDRLSELKDRKQVTIIDCWRVIAHKRFPRNVRYIAWGVHEDARAQSG